MGLQSELDALASRIASFKQPKEATDAQWKAFTDKTVVALMVGGESSRFSPVLEGKAVQKNALILPNGDTMIEMAVRMYARNGFKKFVALVFHNAHTIEEVLGDGSKLGVNIVYSYDPEHPVGKGGAVRNALDNGSIPEDHYLIVANPDDVILGFPDFARRMGEAHIEGEAQGALATAGLALGQATASTGMMVVDSAVVDTQMYPFVPIPAHVGVTLFSPQVFPRFRELFKLTERSDFEHVLFPMLAKEKKLWSVDLKQGQWIAVNDLKSYKQLLAALEKDKSA